MTKHRLDVSVEERDAQTCVFTLAGELYGTSEGYALQEDVRAKIGGGAKRVVVDLGGLRKIDSSGIGILVTIMFSAHKAGGGLVLASLPPNIKELLSMVMLLDRLEHAQSVDDALNRLDAMELPGASR